MRTRSALSGKVLPVPSVRDQTRRDETRRDETRQGKGCSHSSPHSFQNNAFLTKSYRSNVLGQSAALHHYEQMVDGMLRTFQGLNAELQRESTSTPGGGGKKLFSLIAANNALLTDSLLNVGLGNSTSRPGMIGWQVGPCSFHATAAATVCPQMQGSTETHTLENNGSLEISTLSGRRCERSLSSRTGLRTLETSWSLCGRTPSSLSRWV